MKRLEVIAMLEQVREARQQFAKAQATFNSDVDAMMRRLLHEAAHNYMSPEEVARASGFTTKRVRTIMRAIGLNPRDGKTLLSKRASEALVSNAELLGIEPRDMDLMSPLAYLPMGSVLKRELQDRTVSQVHEVSGNVPLDPEHEAALLAIVDQSEGIAPVSIESLVALALDAFLEGYNS